MSTQKKFLMVVAILLVSLLGYLNTHNFIKQQQWKYSRGFYSGDYVSNYKPKNTIISLGVVLIMKDPEKFDFGFYINKNLSIL